MAAELLTDLSRATDSNSSPLSGALWYFYARGTLTPQSVYTTAALNVAHANPVVADSGGRFPPIYMDASLEYRGILKDADGTTLPNGDIDPINASVLGQLAGSGGAALVGFLQAGAGTVARDAEAKLREIEVSITDFTGGTADGTTDNTAALQAAINTLTSGGVVKIPRSASAYRIDLVNITVANITVRMEAGATIKKYGSGGTNRGIFKVANLLDAGFTLDMNGGVIDLNGEGPMGIGVAGRIANTYAAKTVASIITVSGPSNAAVYGLRASGITVKNGTIKNTGETGLLLRNCGGVTIEGVVFENIANWGIEFNIVAAAGDGGTGTMPGRDNIRVRNCSFTDINDFGLASGNGGAIGIGGAGNEGALKSYEFTDNTFTRCYRDIHFEFLTGTWVDGFKINGVQSRDSGHGSIGCIGARNGHLDNITIIDPCHASPLALFYAVTEAASPGNGQYPESTALAFSSDFDDIVLGDNIVIKDSRAGGVVYRTDGVAVAGDATFTSAGASFTTDDIGKPIGIIGAGPSGGTVVHETYITARNSATSVELEIAPVTSNATAKFAYGGGVRNPVSCYGGTSISIGDITVNAGSQFGMTGEPTEAAAIRVKDISGLVKIGNVKLKASANGTSQPCGIRMIDSGLDAGGASTFTGKLRRGNYYASGFTVNEVGTYTRRSATIAQTVTSTVDRAIAPSASAATYGTQESITPTAAFFTAVRSGSFECAGTVGGGETVTFRLTAFFFDSGSSSITIDATATGTTQITAKNLVALNPDGVPIRNLVFDMKSSAAASLATGKVNLVGLQ